MTRQARNDLVATVLGAVVGGVLGGLWSACIWQSSWLVFGLCGAIGGTFGGFLRQTLVEAIFIAVFSLIGLIGLHQSSQLVWVQVAFSLIAGGVAGLFGGSIATIFEQKTDKSNDSSRDSRLNSN